MWGLNTQDGLCKARKHLSEERPNLARRLLASMIFRISIVSRKDWVERAAFFHWRGTGWEQPTTISNKGVPLKVVVPGTAMRGGATAAGGLVGGMFLGWAGPPGWALGGLAGSYVADRYLPSREVLGQSFNKSMEELADRPYYYGAS